MVEIVNDTLVVPDLPIDFDDFDENGIRPETTWEYDDGDPAPAAGVDPRRPLPENDGSG